MSYDHSSLWAPDRWASVRPRPSGSARTLGLAAVAVGEGRRGHPGVERRLVPPSGDAPATRPGRRSGWSSSKPSKPSASSTAPARLANRSGQFVAGALPHGDGVDLDDGHGPIIAGRADRSKSRPPAPIAGRPGHIHVITVV